MRYASFVIRRDKIYVLSLIRALLTSGTDIVRGIGFLSECWRGIVTVKIIALKLKKFEKGIMT